jgi:hypothetical protein
MNEFEAIAEAAYGRYASTRKVNVEENASTLYNKESVMVFQKALVMRQEDDKHSKSKWDRKDDGDNPMNA